MPKFQMDELEGMHKLGAIVHETTVALLFKFDTREQADKFAAVLTQDIAEGHLDFELQLDHRERVQ